MEIFGILLGAVLAIGVAFWLLLFGLVFLIEIVWFVIMLPVRIVFLAGALFLGIFELLGTLFSTVSSVPDPTKRTVPPAEVLDPTKRTAPPAEVLGRFVGRTLRTCGAFLRAVI